MTFSPGDTIECIDNTGRERVLVKYDHYEVLKDSSDHWVKVNIRPGYLMEFRADRFRLVRKATKLAKKVAPKKEAASAVPA